MNRTDLTPTPVTVDVESVPKAPDSGRYMTFETDVKRHAERAHRSRGLIKALMASTIIAAGVAGPEVVDTAREVNQNKVNAAVAKVEAETMPAALENAQATAAFRLFGTKGAAINVDEARKVANQPGTVETLNVSNYVNSDRVKIGEGGKFMTVDGKDFELARRQTEQGHVYILAGRHFVESGLIQDRQRLVSLMLIGGARNDASSDLNQDGITTPEEVRQNADLSARHNLDKAFQPSQRVVVGKTAQNTKH